MKIGISACLLGHRCRYDGTDKRNDELIKLLDGHELIPVCPESSAGFTVPHEPIELKDNKAYLKDETDVTEQLYKGCLKCLKMIEDCDFVILKSKSPSCGYKKIYDGSFNGILIDGNGMFTDLCLQNDMKVFSENDLYQIRGYISR